MAIAKNKLIEKANQEYEYLTGDEATRRLQELREKAILDETAAYATGVKRGEKRGRKEGEKLGKMQTAKEMLKDNFSIEAIIKYTGLSSSVIEQISKKI